MEKIIETNEARIRITKKGDKGFFIQLFSNIPDQYIEKTELVTSYDVPLIEKILEDKGPLWFLNEIDREESPKQIQLNLYYGILSFISPEELKGKRILDFGCGCGSSTMVLARMFPESEIVGIEFLESSLKVAEARKAFYGYSNVTFIQSEDPKSLPENIGTFDYIVLSAVYEHLLPQERVLILPKLFSLLKSGGIMFINELPYRYFPFETHTTGGLPLINYLPAFLVEKIVNRYSKRNLNQNWEMLLRNGIRGGSMREILNNLKVNNLEGSFLKPSKLDVRNDIDIWHKMVESRRPFPKLGLVTWGIRAFKILTGISMIHLLTLALQKPASENN